MTPNNPLSPSTNSSVTEITVVSGLPRSGTSMMMKMLEAGGMKLLVDNIRAADKDNPRGYFEYERVKTLPEGDTSWLADAAGKVVKIVTFFIPYLPDAYHYNIVFMHRAMPEILASQLAMLSNRGKNPDEVDVEMMANIFEKHVRQVDEWVKKQKNVRHLDVWHGDLMSDPIPQITRVNDFFNGALDVDRMHKAIDPNLYRQKMSMIDS